MSIIYQLLFEKLFPYVDYFVVNVSSPNTPNLRSLQDKEPLSKLSKENKLNAYKHNGLFRPVDTIRELEILERELENNDFDF